MPLFGLTENANRVISPPHVQTSTLERITNAKTNPKDKPLYIGSTRKFFFHNYRLRIAGTKYIFDHLRHICVVVIKQDGGTYTVFSLTPLRIPIKLAQKTQHTEHILRYQLLLYHEMLNSDASCRWRKLLAPKRIDSSDREILYKNCVVKSWLKNKWKFVG
jgi:hypothetical protein